MIAFLVPLAQVAPVGSPTMIGMLVSTIGVLAGVVVYMQRQADRKADDRAAELKALYEARIGDRDKHVDRQDRVIEAMTGSLRELTASVDRLTDRVESLDGSTPAPRTRTRTTRRGGA